MDVVLAQRPGEVKVSRDGTGSVDRDLAQEVTRTLTPILTRRSSAAPPSPGPRALFLSHLNVVVVGRQALRAGWGEVHIRADQGAEVAFQLLLDPPKLILHQRRKGGGERP